MCMQSYITTVHSVRPFSLFQNLELGTASTDVKFHFAISWESLCLDHVNSNEYAKFIKIYQKVQGIGPVSLFSEFEPRQNLDLSQISFDNLIGYILSISMCMQNFITIFFTVLEIGLFLLFQNLELGKASTDKKCQFAISWARSCQYHFVQNSALGKASTDDKCHFAIPWARSFQHQIVCKILSKYSKRFKSWHFTISWARSW